MQMLAAFPGVTKYLDWICGFSAPDLRLHQGLKDQLLQIRNLKGTGEVGSVSNFIGVIHSVAKKADLKMMSARKEG